jgi:hypothetical protein
MVTKKAAQDLYVVLTQYSGFMSSDREPVKKVFGPTTKLACEQFIRTETQYDGVGSSRNPMWVSPVKVTYEY